MEILMSFLHSFVMLLAEMAPFLLLGFLLAGILHVWIPQKLYVPKISKPTFKSVLWATIFGIPLPICSCGVIPTAIALHREGASKGASVSFLISTPATGVDSILATYSLLGLPFAILRPIAAFVTALFGGVLTNFASRNETVEEHEHEHEHCECHDHGHEHEHCECHDHDDDDHDHFECQGGCDGHCCEEREIPTTFAGKLAETIRYGLVDMVANVSKWLLIGLALGALISAFVPSDFFMALRQYPILCMLAVLILAMPMYTCATGSIPLALALVAKGLTPGAALVLLMAGPATSIASMLVVGKAFGKRTLVAYLLSIAGGALLFGWIVDSFMMDTFLTYMLPDASVVATGHHALGVFDYVMAGLLVAFIIYSKLPKKSKIQMEASMSKTFVVKGMSCNHCKMSVEKAASKLAGVTAAEANVSKNTLTIEGEVDEAALRDAVEDAGFEFGGLA